MTPIWHATKTYPCDRSSPRAARNFTAARLGGLLGAADEARAVIASAELIISELLTNAINAGCADADVLLDLDRDVLRIAVEDTLDTLPTPMVADEHNDHGRGLQIVASLSRAWGVRRLYPGKQVWAEMALPGGLTGPAA